MPGFNPTNGAASTIENVPPAPGSMPMGPGGMGMMAAAYKGHGKHGMSLHHGPHSSHKGKKAAGRRVSMKRARH